MKTNLRFSRVLSGLTAGILLSLPALAGVIAPDKLSWARPVEGGKVCWSQEPTDATGFYWAYDGEGGTRGNPPSLLGLMPELPYYVDVVQNGGEQLPPLHDTPIKRTLPDSFWYFGTWYEPGDTIYISADGWISFDPASAAGFSHPPGTEPPFPVSNAPNALIAPLWQDNNPLTGTGPENRVHVLDPEHSPGYVVEWHGILGNITAEDYDYEVQLMLGGQDKLFERPACGVMYSFHYIHFCYRESTTDWDADNGETGIEDQAGTKGIHYDGVITPPTPSHLGDGLWTCWAVRAGYKKVFAHDVAAIAWLSPGAMVLRYTEIEPVVVVGNVGLETEHFTANLEIFGPEGNIVYDHNLSAFNLDPGEYDTISAPCWTPEEIGTLYDKVLTVNLEGDGCADNNTFEATSYVHCDDTFRYMWNFAEWTTGWGITQEMSFLTFYGVDGGVLTTGGRVYIYEANPSYNKAAIEVWEADDGCGLPASSNLVIRTQVETHESGWNRCDFGGFGVFAHTAEPGNIWAGVTCSASSGFTGYLAEVGLFGWPAPHPCYLGSGPGRGAYRSGSSYYWGSYSGDYFTMPVELFVHLGFGDFPLSTMPGPPCYNEEAHDITAFRMEQPDQDYVEHGTTITPELAVANIGRQAEPDAGYFPSIFRAIIVETGEVHYEDTVDVGGSNKIGWLGDGIAGNDTMELVFRPWTPESKCDEDEPWVEYDCYGFVQLGEVGPDESDHCPYNDTVYHMVTCLWAHDVGVYDISHTDYDYPGGFNPGTEVIITAHVENYGYNSENDVEVSCEIRDRTADPDTVVYINYQSISFIDWRGNSIGNPYVSEVVFPDWIVPSTNWLVVECRTELVGDMCPLNDNELLIFPPPGTSDNVDVPVTYSLDVSGGVSLNRAINYAVPVETRIELAVYDINGRKVATLHEGITRPGYHNLFWNGRDNAGRTVAAGIYLVRMDAAEYNATKKLIVVK